MKDTLINQLDQLTHFKIKNLAAQRDQIEAVQSQLNSHFHTITKTSNPNESQCATIKQANDLVTAIQSGMLQLNTSADMMLVNLSDDEVGEENWQVYASGQPDPDKCHITAYDQEATLGETSTAFLQVLNYSNQPCRPPSDAIRSVLVSERDKTAETESVVTREANCYKIHYHPNVRGRHKLYVEVENKQINGSPFPITVWSPVEQLGTPIGSIDGLGRSDGIVVNQRGEIIVTAWDDPCVTVFTPNGERLQSFGEQGSSLGQFQYPCGVAVDDEGNIFVADYGNHRIQKFTARGNFEKALYYQGTESCPKPCGIAFNPSNSKIYVGNTNHSIDILNTDLSYVGSFGKKGNDEGEFDAPWHITCDSHGNVFVADCDNHRIQVFTAGGEYLRMFGEYGDSRGKLNKPNGVAVDARNRVYVSELDNHRISVFTSEGQFISSFGSKGKEFEQPYGVAVDDSGVLFVCDFSNKRVQIF